MSVIEICTNGHYYPTCGCEGVWHRVLFAYRVYLINASL